MDTFIPLLIISVLPQLVVPQAPVASFRAVLEMVSGSSRVFSGESVRLKCSIPNLHNSVWIYRWFRGSEQLPHLGQHLFLWKPKVQDGGKYYCQGVRDTKVGDILTIQSLPLEINVDGGWAILQVPPGPSLVGDTLEVTCRVRGGPKLHEVIVYKDGVEVMRQRGLNPHFNMTILSLEQQGMYSCRASWDKVRQTHSVISADAPLQVLEILSEPVLEIVADNDLTPMNKMTLICHIQYNARAPAPPVHYYFYKNDDRLGTATSKNYDLVMMSPGQYSCKAKVPELDIYRWSQPQSFKQRTEIQRMMPLSLHRRDPWPLAPPVSTPDHSQPPVAEPATARPSPRPSTATPTFIQPTTVSTPSSAYPLLKPSQRIPNTVLSTVQSLNHTATPEPATILEGSGDMSFETLSFR